MLNSVKLQEFERKISYLRGLRGLNGLKCLQNVISQLSILGIFSAHGEIWGRKRGVFEGVFLTFCYFAGKWVGN
jgi:hypothetical protein